SHARSLPTDGLRESTWFELTNMNSAASCGFPGTCRCHGCHHSTYLVQSFECRYLCRRRPLRERQVHQPRSLSAELCYFIHYHGIYNNGLLMYSEASVNAKNLSNKGH
ncbi:hypothetical protein CLAIMM_12652, partial [Cladophialophora immunda]